MTSSLLIVSGDRDEEIFNGDFKELVLPTSNGDLVIRSGDSSNRTLALRCGVLKYLSGDHWHSIAMQIGSADVSDGSVSVVLSNSELGSEIDPAAAQAELEAARQHCESISSRDAVRFKAEQDLEWARARVEASKIR